MAFQPGRDIDQKRKAGGVRFGKAVFAEALDLFEAAAGKFLVVAAPGHAAHQPVAKAIDNAAMPEGGHGAPQLIGFGWREAGRDDGDAHGLLLEQRHAEGLVQHPAQLVRRPEGRVRGRVMHCLVAAAAAQVGVHHIALDRPRADDRHFDHQIIVTARLEARQHVHLGPAFNLENTDRVGLAQHVVGRRILARHTGQAEPLAVVRIHQIEAFANAGQHAEGQDVDLENPEGVEIVLVPFNDRAVGHRRIADRHDLREGRLGEHKATHMLRQVAREPDQLLGQLEHQLDVRIGRIEAGFAHLPLAEALPRPTPDSAGQSPGGIFRKP